MNILTFDIEDWFHILDNPKTNKVSNWDKFESRIQIGMDHIFEILETKNLSATFFVLGWIANKYPHIVKKIKENGFEVGSHTHLHKLVYSQNRDEFKNDVEKSIKTIEDCIGSKVISFRAPGFSINKNTKWAFEVLHELGIQIDCSIFSAKRAHGGFPELSIDKPSIIEYQGIRLKEFPINNYNILGFPIIFSGGGYFRISPYNFTKLLTNKSDYVMTYFHPRDFDKEQPKIPGLTKFRNFKSYVGISKCKSKLIKYLNDFDFIDLSEAAKNIDWSNIKIISI